MAIYGNTHPVRTRMLSAAVMAGAVLAAALASASPASAVCETDCTPAPALPVGPALQSVIHPPSPTLLGSVLATPFQLNPGVNVELNPQPLPPSASVGVQLTPGTWVELNPQPLPPSGRIQLTPGTAVELNPQPLPPTGSSLTQLVTINGLLGSQGAKT